VPPLSRLAVLLIRSGGCRRRLKSSRRCAAVFCYLRAWLYAPRFRCNGSVSSPLLFHWKGGARNRLRAPFQRETLIQIVLLWRVRQWYVDGQPQILMLHPIELFEVGHLYSNDEIRFALGVENLGGIRPSLDAQGRVRHLAVITSELECDRNISENPYADRIEGNVLTYTAAGREGDQTLTGRNKRLVEQYRHATPFFGFANAGKQHYRFLGLLQLVRHYRDFQADRRGNVRNVWMFEFVIHASPAAVPITHAQRIASELLSTGVDDERSTYGEDAAAPFNVGDIDALELERVRSSMLVIQPKEFEQFIATLFEISGFARVRTTAFQGDGGIDLNAYVGPADPFFAGTHVQAQVKRWKHTVGSIEINGFRGALASTAKGIFISTGYFSRAAIREATSDTKPCISLVDGRRLAELCVRRDLRP
jgi:hypothetical protein